jgi:hypothetical protein
MPWVLLLALDRAGNSIPARMAMIAMTTSNSMSVKAPALPGRGDKQGGQPDPRRGYRRG